MSAFTWVQLAGLGRISGERWPGVRDAVCADLERLCAADRPHLIVCLGPLTLDASPAGFAALTRRLADLRAVFPGEPPAVLALPGDRDLAAVNPRDPHHLVLGTWHDNHALADEWFWEADSEYRAAVQGWLASYAQWSAACPMGQPRWTRRPGLVPGDAAWRGEFAGASVGVLALTSAYLRGDHGVVHPRQLHALCDGDVPAWLTACDVVLVVTTHAPGALHPSARAALDEHLPPGRIAARLCGPGDDSRSEARNGAPPRHTLCAPLLDPPDAHGGYLVGRIDLGDPPALRVWPRALRRDELGIRCTLDVERWELAEDGGTAPLPLREPRSTRAAPTRDLRAALVQAGVPIAADAVVVGTLVDDDTLVPLAGPPPAADAPTWISAAMPLDELPSTSPDPRRWICGGTLAEIVDKLRGEDPPILAWDGAPLPRDAVLRRSLRVRGAPFLPANDPLWPALLAAARAGDHGRAHGALVVAEPGAGKTVWSRMLTRSFRDGAFGALGGAAWRSARDLAETIRNLPDATWTEWLTRGEPARAAALAALARTRRLVVVVDGLDEVGLAALAQIEAALRRVPGLWIATRRPGDNHDAADVTRLELVPFDSGDRRHLFESLGRPDLARDASRPRSHPRLLVDTPLLLSIEARIVKLGEDPDALPQDQLFARFFEMLLRQAQRDRRLSPEGSQLLRLLVGSVVGTLALLWLRDGALPLDATRVEVVLEQQGLPPAQRIAALDALEFGYLLRPIEGGWEFAHRTLAEWAAAAALHRDVERRLQQDPDAPAERSVLAPFLAEPGPRHRGRWQQLLRFYAPHVLDPVGLLTALVGPDAAPHWGSARDADDARASVPSEYEVHGDYDKELSFARELLLRCRWPSGAAARACWALVARAWLLRHPTDVTPPLERAFLDALAPHLPATLAGIVALYAVDAAARAALTVDPTPLLPVLPIGCSRVLADHLITAPPGQQHRILGYANQHGADLPARWLRDAVFADPILEAEAWEAVIRLGEAPPWPALRRCALEWPRHLTKPLLAWFARTPRTGFRDDALDRRKIVLGIVLGRSTAARAALDELLADQDPQHLPTIAGQVLARLDDRDAHGPQSLLKRLLRARGVEAMHRHGSRDAPQAAVEALDRLVVAADHWQGNLRALVGALDRPGLDAVAGDLWRGLPPDAAERPRLLAAFKHARNWPAVVDVASVLAAYEPYDRLRGLLAPEHLAALRRRIDEQTGAARHAAVLQLAEAEASDPVVAVLAAFRPGDPAYESTLRAYLDEHSPPEALAAAVALPTDLLVRLPLTYQAALGAPGWHGRLLSALAGDDLRADWIGLASEHQLVDALPLLLARLDQLPVGPAPWDIQLSTWLSAIVALCPADDPALGGRALRAVLARADPRRTYLPDPAALAAFLGPADIPLLLAFDPSTLAHPALRDRMRALGPPAFTALLELHRTSSGQPRRALHATLVAIADPTSVPLAVVLELCGDLRPDSYTVSSSPGPLGAEFDEPEDQLWHVDHDDGSLRSLGPLLAACVRARPADWHALAPLLGHPSALLRSHAFAAILEHAPWDPRRTADMLARILAAPSPTISGDPRFALAVGRAEQVGEIRDAWSEALRHLEAFLGHQHEVFLVLLTRDDAPRLRAAGAEWIGKLGTPAWVDYVAPLLADPSPGVFFTALRAILRLDAARAPASLAAASRVAWTHEHYVAALARAVHGPTSLERYHGASERERLELPADLAFALLDEAANLPQPSDRHDTMFSGFPSACERLVDRLDRFDVPLVARWAASADFTIRAAARRLLAAQRALDPAPLLALLPEDSVDLLSAAECLTHMHCTAHRDEIVAAWRRCDRLKRDWHLPADRRMGLWHLEDRLLWAIHGESAPAWASLLGLALSRIPHDSEDMTLTSHGEVLVEQGRRILRSLDRDGLREVVVAMDAGKIEEYVEFTDLIVERARTDVLLLTELIGLDGAGNSVARRLLVEATHVSEDPRDTLAAQLRRVVFVPSDAGPP